MTDAATLATPPPAEWHPLPPRARSLFVLSHASLGLLFAVPVTSFVGGLQLAPPIVTAILAALLGAFAGAAIGVRRHRSVAWRLDEEGFALRRGRMWFRETRVPASRVQHLDLKHGPLERRWKLATLVIHTAGSRMSAVSVSGLDAIDAETLRDRLAQQLDHDDAL